MTPKEYWEITHVEAALKRARLGLSWRTYLVLLDLGLQDIEP